MDERNERDRSLFGLDQNDGAIEHGAGGAHPGAQQGTMRCRIMLSVVLGMLGRLRLSYPADCKQCENQKNREGFADSWSHFECRAQI